MDYLKRSIELARDSLDSGSFPAGSVLVTASGAVYESRPSSIHYHEDMMVIDDAIAAEGASLAGAILYDSIHPCIMCSAKIYWAGITTVQYVISKSSVDARYVYENNEDVDELVATFFAKISMTHMPALQTEALKLYSTWIENLG